jgi:phage replication-related protein YjqB (UPF0714/DUF867 family)
MRSQFPTTGLQLARRGFLQALGATTIPLFLPGCGNEDTPQPQFRFANMAPAVEVKHPQFDQAPLQADPCLCSLPKQLANFADVGDQIRVIRNNNEFALYTVAELREQDNPSLMRMSLHARKRLNTPGTFGAQIGPVTHSELSDVEAEAAGEFVERLDDDGESTGLLVLAPHGGEIEPGTDEQAQYVKAILPNTSSWLCKGWHPDGDAYKRWHISAAVLSPNSFPGLAMIADRGFDYAVAFHGMKNAGVIVGGGAPYELLAVVRNAIAGALGNSAGPVILADKHTPLDGDSPNNMVNWLTLEGEGGVQIEQSLTVRTLYGQAVAKAVASVYEQLV